MDRRVTPPKQVTSPTWGPPPPCKQALSRGDWLGTPANIKVENNGAVVYVGSSLTVHNPLFSVHKL